MVLVNMELFLEAEKGIFVNQNMGSLMQGAFMERIDPTYAEVLHRSELKPYSQFLSCRNGSIKWAVRALTEESERQIAPRLLDPTWEDIFLTQKRMTLHIKERNIHRLTAEELLEQTFFSQCPRTVSILFLTPTAFKANGIYQNYPTVHHIFQSLINRYNTVNENTELPVESTLESILHYVSISKYNLHSTTYGIEGVQIPAFQGNLTMKLSGPQQLVNLIHMLLCFGGYSGVGIKTAMGMGAIQVIKQRRRDDAICRTTYMR